MCSAEILIGFMYMYIYAILSMMATLSFSVDHEATDSANYVYDKDSLDDSMTADIGDSNVTDSSDSDEDTCMPFHEANSITASYSCMNCMVLYICRC